MSTEDVTPTAGDADQPEPVEKPAAARKPATRKTTDPESEATPPKVTTARRAPAAKKAPAAAKKPAAPTSAAGDADEIPAKKAAAAKRTTAEKPAAAETAQATTAAKTTKKASAAAGSAKTSAASAKAAPKPTEPSEAAPAVKTEKPAEPAQVPILPEIPHATTERRVYRGTGRRVVVAEDEALIRLDVVETLSEAGFDVVGEAGDGEKAVELATELRPDVVVMDIKMPVLDGISAAERIGKARIAPVVLLTAFSQAELVERARDAGAMAYVVKPFTPAELLPAIEIAVARHQQITALESEIADLSERFETRKRVERAKGLLQTKMGLTEPESFRWIQKTSMDRRLTMREVADAVIEQVGSGDPGR